MRKLLLLVMIALLLFTACSLKNEEKTADADDYVTVIDTEGLSYDYNHNGTALLSLQKKYVNALIEMDKQTQKTITKEELWIKASNLFSKNFVVAHGYYPKGDNGKLLVDVVDGEIDLSKYYLDGDLNYDGMIDHQDIDLLIDALVNSKKDDMYDLNKDNSIDNKDLVYLSARMLIDASSFSIYTEDGKKLDVQEVPYVKKGKVKDKAFEGLSQVSVLVNDINGDNQLEQVAVSDSTKESRDTKTPGIRNVLSLLSNMKVFADNDKRAYEKEELFKAFIRETTEYIRKQKINKYLTSWYISFEVIDIVKIGDEFTQLSGGMDSFKNRIDRMVEDELVRDHFQYDMGVFHRESMKDYYKILLGKDSGSKDALTANVNAVKNSETKVLISPSSENKYYKSIVNYATVYCTEEPVMAIEGDITIEGWTNPSGKIKFSRLGPGYKHDDLIKEYDIENGKFKTGNDLATGEYRVDYYVPGEKIMYTLFGDSKDNTFIFVGNEKEPSKVQWDIKSGGVTIYGFIEENGEPLEGKEVILTPQYKKSGVKDTKKVLTDEEGKYKIDNVPFGAYDVLVGEKGSSKEEKSKKQEIGAVDGKSDGNLKRLLGEGLSNDKDEKADEDFQLEWEAECHGMSVEEYKEFKKSENNRTDFENSLENGDASNEADKEQSSGDVEDDIFNILEELMKSLLSWFADWDKNAIEVPKIEYQSTYDIEFIWKMEDELLVTSRWHDIPLTESSKIISEYNSSAYVISEKEDIQPDDFHVEIFNAKIKDLAEVKYDPTDITLGVYKIAEDMTLSKQDLMDMESEEPLEDFEIYGETIDGMDMFGAMLDHFDLTGEYKKDTLYIEIDLYWELAFKDAMDDLGMEYGLPYAANLGMLPENMKDEFLSGYISKSDFEKLTANDYKYSAYSKKKSEGKVSYTLTIKTHKKE